MSVKQVEQHFCDHPGCGSPTNQHCCCCGNDACSPHLQTIQAGVYHGRGDFPSPSYYSLCQPCFKRIAEHLKALIKKMGTR